MSHRALGVLGAAGRYRQLGVDTDISSKANLRRQFPAPGDSTLSASQPAQEGGRFSLTALLSTSSLVCYNDTIFRDGFDGTGL